MLRKTRHRQSIEKSRRQYRTRLILESLEYRTLLASPQPWSDPSAQFGATIAAENQLPGLPQGSWWVNGDGDDTLQGFATDISVNHGSSISFKIDDSANVAYHIDILRMGYYGGAGARLVTTIPSANIVQQVQPNPIRNDTTGMADAGNWGVSAIWNVPANATSGIYLARMVRNDTGGASIAYFIVRADDSHSSILFQT
jgi:hypothetical protein